MDLQTISQVSKTFGISTQMLRYYEQKGLVKSSRMESYAYRVYDDENIKRIQQTIIFRKLQIPIKQIALILNNPDAVTVTDIFYENIKALDDEINALETIKSALKIFVKKIEDLAIIRLDLNLLNDESVMQLAQTLSLTQKNVKEIQTLETLNQASEILNRTKQNLVRIVYRPTEIVAKMWCEGCDPPDENAKMMMEKFIRDNDLFRIKPNFKVFSHGHGTGSWFFVTIPENLEVFEPFIKAPFEGGLWAVTTITKENNEGGEAIGELYGDWENKNNKGSYKNAQLLGRPRHEVYFNPLNISNLKNTNIFNTVFNPDYFDIYIPLTE